MWAADSTRLLNAKNAYVDGVTTAAHGLSVQVWAARHTSYCTYFTVSALVSNKQSSRFSWTQHDTASPILKLSGVLFCVCSKLYLKIPYISGENRQVCLTLVRPTSLLSGLLSCFLFWRPRFKSRPAEQLLWRFSCFPHSHQTFFLN